MNTTKRILVTGSAGRLGQAVVTELVAHGHTVIGLDIRETSGLPTGQSIVGSITDAPLLKWLARDTDCVVHLAATPDDAKDRDGNIQFDNDGFVSGLLPNNLHGTYCVMEAVRGSRGKRVILTSSGQTIEGHLPDSYGPSVVPKLVTTDVEFRPVYLYACTKVFLEAMGQVYSRHHGITALVVRPGWCPRDADQERQIAADSIAQDVYLSPGDAGRFFTAASEAEGLPAFAVVYVASKPTTHQLYDLSDAKRLTGWEPLDVWPQGLKRTE